MANSYRTNAYNLFPERLEEIRQELMGQDPAYMIGYASTLNALARHIRDTGGTLRRPRLKLIVNTAEGIGDHDRRIVEEVFGVPVINEYGLSEGGVIGYSVGQAEPLRVLWHDFSLMIRNRSLHVTTLADRCFPLVNYDSEDVVKGDGDPEGRAPILSLAGIQGKFRHVVKVPLLDGPPKTISTILIDHMLKGVPEVQDIYYTAYADHGLDICYTTNSTVAFEDRMRDFMVRTMDTEGVAIDMRRIRFKRLEERRETIAGKRQVLKRVDANFDDADTSAPAAGA